MTTRLLDCLLVIQHSHEEWPVLDDLLYLMITLISIAMLRYLIMTYGIVASTFFLFRWCCRYVDGRHSKRLPLRWIFSSLDPSWQVAHSFFPENHQFIDMNFFLNLLFIGDCSACHVWLLKNAHIPEFVGVALSQAWDIEPKCLKILRSYTEGQIQQDMARCSGVLSCFLCFVMFLWRPCFKTHQNNNRHVANNQNLRNLFFRRTIRRVCSIGWSYCMLFFPWGCPQAMFGTLGFPPFPDISNESLTRRGCGLAEKALSLFWVQQDNAITSLVRVLRLVRIFRITRLLQRTKALRELSKLVSMMATCLKAMNMWTSLNIIEHHWRQSGQRETL